MGVNDGDNLICTTEMRLPLHDDLSEDEEPLYPPVGRPSGEEEYEHPQFQRQPQPNFQQQEHFRGMPGQPITQNNQFSQRQMGQMPHHMNQQHLSMMPGHQPLHQMQHVPHHQMP